MTAAELIGMLRMVPGETAVLAATLSDVDASVIGVADLEGNIGSNPDFDCEFGVRLCLDPMVIVCDEDGNG